MKPRLLLILTALLASILSSASPAAAAVVTCDGHRATHVATPRNDGRRVIVTGTSGDDVIVGTPGRDVIRGLAGNDIICGGGGRDVIYGGRGRDLIRGEGGVDRMVGGTGPDMLLGGGGNDLLKGGFGEDEIVGGRGADRCIDDAASMTCETINGKAAAVQENDQVDVHQPIGATQWVAAMEDEIIRLVNVERSKAGVAPLTENTSLDNGSRGWSSHLSTSSTFQHDPNLDWHVGENIAQNYWLGARTTATARQHAAEMMDQWMNSSGHRQNILRESYHQLGVGVALSGNLTYGTQRFSILEP
jgi:uncharacterized protein YkwD